MEYNLGLWSQDLTPIARLMEEENEDFLALKWRDGESGDMFFSLLFSPCGYVVFELVSDTLDIEGVDVVEHPNPRFCRHFKVLRFVWYPSQSKCLENAIA